MTCCAGQQRTPSQEDTAGPLGASASGSTEVPLVGSTIGARSGAAKQTDGIDLRVIATSCVRIDNRHDRK